MPRRRARRARRSGYRRAPGSRPVCAAIPGLRSVQWRYPRSVLEGVEAVLLDAGGVLLMPNPDLVGPVLNSFGLDGSPAGCAAVHWKRMHLFDLFGGVAGWDQVDRRLFQRLGLAPERVSTAVAALGAVVGGGRSVPANGARSTLQRLTKQGFRLGVVSNSDGTLQERLDANAICAVGGSELAPAEFILDSGVVGIEKPDLRIFEMAKREIGVPAGQCLFVGDSVRNDIEPAEAVGFIGCHLDPLRLCSGGGHAHIGSVDELTRTNA